jgi:EpsI family protein
MPLSPFSRTLIVTVCLLAGAGLIARASRSEIIPIRAPLTELPLTLGEWRGRPAPDFDAAILDVLGVDDYINRWYSAAGVPVLSLYVGYYESQRQGDTMHSPLNCLPGAGWIPVVQRRITIPVMERGRERQVEVNSFVIEKGIERQAVLYWYQSRGRIVASEYWGKIYSVLDAMRYNRTDGAMVRVVLPIVGSEADAGAVAERRAVGFVQQLFPVLSEHLPL